MIEPIFDLVIECLDQGEDQERRCCNQQDECHSKGGLFSLQLVQFLTYTVIMILLVVSSITGLVLYVHVYHQGLGGWLHEPMRAIEAMMGGLATVRYIHHIAVWGFLIFIPIHIYMVIWSAIRFKHAALDVMFTGYDYHLKKEEKAKEDQK